VFKGVLVFSSKGWDINSMTLLWVIMESATKIKSVL